MAIIKSINSKSNVANGIKYITREDKTEDKLISGYNCSPEFAIEQMNTTKELYNKTGGRQYKHYVQSFNPKDNVTPEIAHEIGNKFISENEKFNGYEVVIATHKDRNHIHNHFIVNSVNLETGKKYHESAKDLQQLKELSNELTKQYGLTVPEKSAEQGKITTFDQGKYQALNNHNKENYKSYLVLNSIALNKVINQATSKDDFIEKMEKEGYKTNWKDTRKNITFENEKGQKVRLSNLEKTFNNTNYNKENLLERFEKNKESDTKDMANNLEEKIFEKKQDILRIENAIEGVNNNLKKYEWIENKVSELRKEIEERENTNFGVFAFKKNKENEEQIEKLKLQLTDQLQKLDKEKPRYETSKDEYQRLVEYKKEFEKELEKNEEKLAKTITPEDREKLTMERIRANLEERRKQEHYKENERGRSR